MRYLGILGGMSTESTAEYYRMLNRAINARLGGMHSAPLLIHSVDFADVAQMMRIGAWSDAGILLSNAALGLERAGAEGILLATNSLHEVAPAIEAAIGVPFLHIVDSTGAAMQRAGIKRAGLLGTSYTMELPFWKNRLFERFGVALDVPDASDRAVLHRIIFEELVQGRCEPQSRADYVRVIERLAAHDAEAVIFGCTEIGLLLKPSDSPLPVFDTAALHVETAVEFILGTA